MATQHNEAPASRAISDLVARLATQLETRGWRLATAESCTGGLVAGACTERAGSSVWFERGVVSYSNNAKTSLLGVPAELIVAEGAVSEAVARAMALGAQLGAPGAAEVKSDGGDRTQHLADDRPPASATEPGAAVEVAVSITGVAGPGGGSAAKPIGTVCFGWALPDRCWTERCWFDGDRASVRRQSVAHVLGRLVDALEMPAPSPGTDTSAALSTPGNVPTGTPGSTA